MRRWHALVMLLWAAHGHAAESPAFTAKQLCASAQRMDNERRKHLQPTLFASDGNQRRQRRQLKAEWQTHLNGSGVGPPFSGEAQPIVQTG